LSKILLKRAAALSSRVLSVDSRFSRLSAGQTCLIAAILLLLSGGAIGLIAAFRTEEIPSYYIVRWNDSGKCSVITEQPPQGRGRLIWLGNLRVSADDKLREFMRAKRCR